MAAQGGLEWSGRWKVLQHYAAHMYRPLLVSPWTSPSVEPPPFGVVVSAHPPAAMPIPNGTVQVTCWSWAVGRVGAWNASFSVVEWPAPEAVGQGAGGSVSVVNTTLTDALGRCGCPAPDQCVITVDVFNSSTLLDTNWLYVAPLRNVTTMVDPGLAITDVVAVFPGTFDVTITASHVPAAGVWIESLLCCGHFSDNGFLLTAPTVTLRYEPSPDSRGWAHTPPPGSELNITAGQFAASLSVWSTAGYGSPSSTSTQAQG